MDKEYFSHSTYPTVVFSACMFHGQKDPFANDVAEAESRGGHICISNDSERARLLGLLPSASGKAVHAALAAGSRLTECRAIHAKNDAIWL